MTEPHYSYRATWSPEDEEYVGLCEEFESLSWLAETPTGPWRGILRLVGECLADMEANGETPPAPRAETAQAATPEDGK